MQSCPTNNLFAKLFLQLTVNAVPKSYLYFRNFLGVVIIVVEKLVLTFSLLLLITLVLKKKNTDRYNRGLHTEEHLLHLN